MDRLELVEKVKEELEKTPLIIGKDRVITFGPYFQELLLIEAREAYEGRKGLYSKKSRIRKKIMKLGLDVLLNRTIAKLKGSK